jgi:PD-(D/E)XK nuclease superfamily
LLAGWAWRGPLVVVDLKTAARKYSSDVQVETSLQLTIYCYAAEMAGPANHGDVGLRFDVLTKTKEPAFHRHPTSRDQAANVRLFRLASEVLRAVGAGGALTAALFDPVPLDQTTGADYAIQDAATKIPAEVGERFATADKLSDEDRQTIIEIARLALSRFQPTPGARPAVGRKA